MRLISKKSTGTGALLVCCVKHLLFIAYEGLPYSSFIFGIEPSQIISTWDKYHVSPLSLLP